jgi:hypothetical protein
LSGIPVFLTYCDGSDERSQNVPLRLRLIGDSIDTAYVSTRYRDKGAVVYGPSDNTGNWIGMAITPVEAYVKIRTTGEVSTRVPGTYTIGYSATDTTGVELTPVTRTVHVVENPSAFLNGLYDVTYTTTATEGSTKTTTAGTYTAMVENTDERNRFQINALKIGPQFVFGRCALVGNKVEIDFYHQDFDYRTSGTGTLSAAKSTFTLQNAAYQYSPRITYSIKTVFKKRLAMIASDNGK